MPSLTRSNLSAYRPGVGGAVIVIGTDID
jgi:hypothetical protein